MKAVVYHGPGDIRLDDVPEPGIEAPNDAIVRITSSAICGTDLHLVRGTVPGMREGTVLGHEAVGVIEETCPAVRNLRPRDRVVIGSTISCGYCSYCRAGYTAQCDNANPNGPLAGTAFFGGPADTGPFNGLQAEYARIPFANVIAVKLPDEVSDEQAIVLSDIYPTAWFGAELAEVGEGDTVAVFGCGPVGLLTVQCAQLHDAGRVIAVDLLEDRLEVARTLGAEVVDASREDPVAAIRELTGGIGVDRAVDAVGVDAVRPHHGPAAESTAAIAEQQSQLATQIAGRPPGGGAWAPGNAPGIVLRWAVEALAKAGSLGVIGVYPPAMESFPTGMAMNKNLTVRMGNCNHRRYLPMLVGMVRSGAIDPSRILTQREGLIDVLDAYEEFDRRRRGWVKVRIVAPGNREVPLRGHASEAVGAGPAR
jgi:threonine dehydrogenase-like Zn-dependent dehydrogenase